MEPRIERCVVTKDEWLQVRMDEEEKAMIEALALRTGMNMSELIRYIVRFVYKHPDWFDFYMEREE